MASVAVDRAAHKPHHAWVNDDGSLRVRCSGHRCWNPDTHWHRVTYTMTVTGTVVFTCDCKGGTFRQDTVPCWHAGKAARRLVREGIAVETATGYRVARRILEAAQAKAAEGQPEDPFYGLGIA